MASSSSSAMHFSDESSDLSFQSESEMESSRIRHWSNLRYNSNKSSEWSVETNIKHYNLLKSHREWGRFFRDFPSLELGKKISEGAQADIYEARTTRDGPFNLVAKVMKGDVPLEAFQAQWPVGMLSASKDYFVSRRFNLPLMTILGGTLLEDRRLEGRFAFVMYRWWGDLRLLIDRRMKLERSTVGPFFMDQVIQLMSMIAEDMEGLHTEHDILHRDLKASNVLVWGELGDNVNVVAPRENEKIRCVVADFECSMGVMGSRWWRAPEILRHSTERVASSKVQFTRASDVYSYAMTCYEIVSGHIPFEDWSAPEAKAAILNGVRPNLLDELPSYLRSIIESCWQNDPEKRPNFSDICMMLKYKQGCNPTNVVIDNECNQNASVIKVEQWGNLQPSPLIQGWETLMRMGLWVSVAEILQTHTTTGMVVQYFEVTDGEGSKIWDENIIGNIVKVLSFPVKIQWITGMSDADTPAETYLIQIMSEAGETSLVEMVSAILSEMKSLVYKVECLKQNLGHIKCSMYVEGGKLGSLLPKVLAKAAGSGARLDCMIELRKLASRDANLELQHVELEDADAVGETYVILTTSETGGPSLLGRLSAFLIGTINQVYKVKCCCSSHSGHVACAIYVEGNILDSMSSQFLAKLGEIARASIGMVELRKLASRDVNFDLPTVKSSFRAPRCPPAIRIHLYLDKIRLHDHLSIQVICHHTRELLANVACSSMDLRITSTITFETFEIPSYCCIQVPHFCMEDEGQNNYGDGRTGIMGFVRRFFNTPWIRRWDVFHAYKIKGRRALEDHLRQYTLGGEVELIYNDINSRNEISMDIIKQSLQQNGLFVLSGFVQDNCFTIFVSTLNR